MDEHTLRILEFDKIRQMVARYAPCSLGAERARSMQPTTDRSIIDTAQRLVAEMLRLITEEKTLSFGEIKDIRANVRRARAEAMLGADDLRVVSGTVLGLKRIRESLACRSETFPNLARLASGIHDASPVAYDIQARIDQRSKVMDSASRELGRLRSEIEKLDERIRAMMQRLVRSESMKRALSYPNYTITGSHYVLPIAKDYRHDMPGIVHRTSASGDTLFIEPAEAAEMSAELALLRSHEQREVSRILRQLSLAVGQVGQLILDGLEIAGELSFICAKSRYAQAFAMVEPRFSPNDLLCLQDARHPVLEQLFREEAATGNLVTESTTSHISAPAATQFQPVLDASSPAVPKRRTVVPVSVHLGGRFDVLVVTGPNTGGKTVALKTVGLLALMAQSGLHIPAADGSALPVCDAVLADIGDEQSLEQSLSTFSSHVSRIAAILRLATPRSLVLLDELGAGTDPAEGAALGRAILDRLVEVGGKAIVTTHLGDLKMYALTHPRSENAAVEFDSETLRPTYRLRIGDTGGSSALIIARRLNLPASVVDQAERYLASSRAGRPQELDVLEQRRAEAEEASKRAWEAQQDARRAKESYENRLRELDRQAADALALAEFRSTLQPGDTVHVRKFRRAGVVKRVDHKRGTAYIAHGSMQWELSLEELEPESDAATNS
jgi:DNA mismatch repair protein MutS2